MIEMNPYYAHRSSVGDVFDVASWSPRKALGGGLFCLLAGLVVATATCYMVQPKLLVKNPPKILKELNQEMRIGWKKHPWGMQAGLGGAGCMAFMLLAGGVATLGDFLRSDYYLRAGTGGVSLRVPQGVSWSKLCLASKVLRLDLSWDQVERWTVVQEKQIGSLSPNDGNIAAHIDLKTSDGKTHSFSVDCFREPARIIYQKLQDAMKMTTARLAPAEPVAPPTGEPSLDSLAEPATGPVAATIEEKVQRVLEALESLVRQTGDQSAVVFSDARTGKYVQFVGDIHGLTLDLPLQALDEGELQRATRYFDALGQGITESELTDRPGGTVTGTHRSFQFHVTDGLIQAAQLTLGLFDNVYLQPADFSMVVEEV
ncbi:MAG: hypothetical protein HQ581_08060 [Planctomycetes bacterium]|nr:hypothetical protein [Planctomycetota bacterium]